MGLNLILVAGLPASGKSGFAAYAGEQLHLPVIVKDDLKEILFDDIGFRNREEKVKLGVAAMDLMYATADKLLGQGISVILDNNFETGSVPGLKQLTERHPCRLITVRFDGDVEAVYQRFLKRDQDPARHRGHVVNTAYPEKEREPYVPLSLEAFEKKFRQRGMMDFYAGGALLTVDVTTFDHYSPEDLLKRLKDVMA